MQQEIQTIKESASSPQQRFYEQYKDAYEEHERLVWEREQLLMNLERTQKDAIESKKLDAITAELQKALEKLKQLIFDSKQSGESVYTPDLGLSMKEKSEKELLEFPSDRHQAILKSALLRKFLDQEKKSSSSVYRKRLKKGFSASVEALISEEKEKNKASREKLFQKYSTILKPEEAKLIDFTFRRRMARHGIPVRQ